MYVIVIIVYMVLFLISKAIISEQLRLVHEQYQAHLMVGPNKMFHIVWTINIFYRF